VLEAMYATGHWLLTVGRPGDAARVFRFMILAEPADERGWLALAACHEALGQPAIALDLYRIGMVAAAPAPRCALGRARLLRREDGEVDEADDAYAIAFELAELAGDDELARAARAEASAR
jgi:hypothetical protein